MTSFSRVFFLNVVQMRQRQDSGASKHMSARREEFINYTPTNPKPIRAADQRTFDAIGKGDLRVELPKGTRSSTIVLKNPLSLHVRALLYVVSASSIVVTPKYLR